MSCGLCAVCCVLCAVCFVVKLVQTVSLLPRCSRALSESVYGQISIIFTSGTIINRFYSKVLPKPRVDVCYEAIWPVIKSSKYCRSILLQCISEFHEIVLHSACMYCTEYKMCEVMEEFVI